MKYLIVFILMLTLFACSTTTQMSKSKNIVIDENIDASNIVIKNELDVDLGPYQILDRIYVRKSGRFGTENRTKNEMSKIAASIGADAIIGYQYDEWAMGEYSGDMLTKLEFEWGMWASGLAIKFGESDPRSKRPEYTIALMPLIDPGSNIDENLKDKMIRIRLIAQCNLEKLGYYARKIDSDFGVEEILSMSKEDLEKIGGKNVSLIFILYIEEFSQRSAIITGKGEAGVKAIMLSKDTGTKIWEGSISDVEYRSFGIWEVATVDEHWVALHRAFRYLFKSLPPNNRMFDKTSYERKIPLRRPGDRKPNKKKDGVLYYGIKWNSVVWKANNEDIILPRRMRRWPPNEIRIALPEGINNINYSFTYEFLGDQRIMDENKAISLEFIVEPKKKYRLEGETYGGIFKGGKIYEIDKNGNHVRIIAEKYSEDWKQYLDLSK